MLAIDIPGFGDLRLEHLALNFNGTVALDGTLLPAAPPLLRALSGVLAIHVVTADAFGTAAAGLPPELVIIGNAGQDEAKRAFAGQIRLSGVVAIGNDRNDSRVKPARALAIRPGQECSGQIQGRSQQWLGLDHEGCY